jgi:hypothetical protein
MKRINLWLIIINGIQVQGMIKKIIFEENPCRNYKQTLNFKGVNYSTSAGYGYLETWQKDKDETWQCRETFDHWRR